MIIEIIDQSATHLITADFRAWKLADYKRTYTMRLDHRGWFLVRKSRWS